MYNDILRIPYYYFRYDEKLEIKDKIIDNDNIVSKKYNEFFLDKDNFRITTETFKELINREKITYHLICFRIIVFVF